MILWDGGDIHEAPPAPEGCWGDRNGEDCGDAAAMPDLGLCVSCYVRLTGERPALVPGPPSEAFTTGAGRR